MTAHNRIIMPEGKWWCRRHQLFLPVAQFTTSSQKRHVCRACAAIEQRMMRETQKLRMIGELDPVKEGRYPAWDDHGNHWCSGHQAYINPDLFSSYNRYHCQECTAASNRKHRLKKKKAALGIIEQTPKEQWCEGCQTFLSPDLFTSLRAKHCQQCNKERVREYDRVRERKRLKQDLPYPKRKHAPSHLTEIDGITYVFCPDHQSYLPLADFYNEKSRYCKEHSRLRATVAGKQASRERRIANQQFEIHTYIETGFTTQSPEPYHTRFKKIGGVQWQWCGDCGHYLTPETFSSEKQAYCKKHSNERTKNRMHLIKDEIKAKREQAS